MRRAASLATGLFAPMALALALAPRIGPADDAYISYRYAWNLVHGAGLVYNAGDRVEGFSNPLWTLLSALPIGAGFEPYSFMRGLSLAAVCAILAALYFAAERPDGSRPPFILSTWLLASSMPMLSAAASGLETTLFVALLFGSAVAQARASNRARGAACALFFLAVWTRPEGAVFATLLILAAPPGDRRAAKVAPLACTAAALALLVAARLLYYQALLPNTFGAKVALDAGQLQDGLRYLGSYLTAYPAIAALSLSALFIAPREVLVRRRALLALPIFACVYAVAIGGDWMPDFRFLVIVEPFLLVLADEWLRPEHFTATRKLAAFSAALTLLLGVERAKECGEGLPRAADYNAAWNQSGGRVARWLRDGGARGLIAVGDIGVVGWENRETLRVLDLYGLVDKVIAAIPGRHMKKLGPAYRDRVFGSNPDYIVLRGDHSCDEPLDREWIELYYDYRFRQRYTLSMRTDETGRFGWCLYSKK